MTTRWTSRILEPLLLVAVFWLAGGARLLAYLDPGTGNVLLQVLLSVAIGVSLTARRLLKMAGQLFRRSPAQAPADDRDPRP
jgi:hypothetical protein